MRELPLEAPWADAVQRAAAVLYAAGATGVWLFGSRAAAGAADRLSDFDLAVEGLGDTERAVAQASRVLGGRLDVVRLESANPDMRWGISRTRMLVPRVDPSRSTRRWPPWRPASLAGARLRAVVETLRASAPRSVIDFGCGHGGLLAELAADDRYERLTGVDFRAEALAGAERQLPRAIGPHWRAKVNLREGLITHRDPAFLGHEAATAVEVIEHLEPPQLAAFVGVVFDFVRPILAVVTTPNAEYNVLWGGGRSPRHRHPDHRFEWSRAEFAAWAEGVAAAHGYTVRAAPVGRVHPRWGAPTQLASFALPSRLRAQPRQPPANFNP